MSEEQLVNIIREAMDDETDTSSPRRRIFKTAQKGNNIFAENIGGSVYKYLDTIYFERIKTYVAENVGRLIENVSRSINEYLDTIYFERIKTYVAQTYEERIKNLEDKVASLEARPTMNVSTSPTGSTEV